MIPQWPIPPWEQAGYFSTPKVTVSLAPGGSDLQIAAADPMRVLLTFAFVGPGTTVIFWGTGTGTSVGYLLSGNFPVLIVDYYTWGPLVFQQWWLRGTSTAGIVTSEVGLIKFPPEAQDKSRIIIPSTVPNVNSVRRTDGNGNDIGFRYRWPKSAAEGNNDIASLCRGSIDLLRKDR